MVRFTPCGWHGHHQPESGVVVFRVHNPDSTRYDGHPEPLTQAEVDYLTSIVARHAPVADTWNGTGFDSLSVGVDNIVNPSVQAALGRYRDGCPDHPDRSVFCDCATWRAGFKRAVGPAYVYVDRPAATAPASGPDDDDRNLRAVRDALNLIRPILADVGYHPDTIVAGRRGDITEDADRLSFDPKSGHGVCLPAEAAVRLVQLLTDTGAL